MKFAQCHPDRAFYAKDLCAACYNAAWRKSHPAERRAHQRREYVKNKARYQAAARVYYDANRETIIAKVAAWHVANPGRRRDAQLRLSYGMTRVEYIDNIIGQAGRCLICLRVPDRDLVVDHDHTSGRFRGLLCASCNLGLGKFSDDPQRLVRAAAYVERAA